MNLTDHIELPDPAKFRSIGISCSHTGREWIVFAYRVTDRTGDNPQVLHRCASGNEAYAVVAQMQQRLDVAQALLNL